MFETNRLVLRQWSDADRKPFAALNQCKEVMRYFPRLFSFVESNNFVTANQSLINSQGWGAWAVEIIETQEFIGFVGFSHPASWHPCAGEIEIGWRLDHKFWNRGFATEAARYALNIGFNQYGFDHVVSFTSTINKPSISVMQKLGMTQAPHGFTHPLIAANNPLCRHVIFRKFASPPVH